MAAPFGHSHLISYECLGDSSPSVLCLFTLTPMVIPFFWYCSPRNGSQLLCCLTSIIAMILKELPLVHSFSHRETFIHLFTQNIDLKPLDWSKLILDDLHPGRCNSTVILLLSTQSSFREEVQITESLQEVLQNRWRSQQMLFKCLIQRVMTVGYELLQPFQWEPNTAFRLLPLSFLSCPCWANEKNLSRA